MDPWSTHLLQVFTHYGQKIYRNLIGTRGKPLSYMCLVLRATSYLLKMHLSSYRIIPVIPLHTLEIPDSHVGDRFQILTECAKLQDHSDSIFRRVQEKNLGNPDSVEGLFCNSLTLRTSENLAACKLELVQS